MSSHRTVYKISPSPDSTLAVEVRKTGWVKRKHLFVFEQYTGALLHNPDSPLDSELSLTIDAASVSCRDGAEKLKQQTALTRFAKEQALSAFQHPSITVLSQRFTAKPLRGFVAEGSLSFRGIDRKLRANIDFGPPKRDRLQIDADATLHLSEYDIPRPSSLFGLVRTDDEVVLHALLWGIMTTSLQATSSGQA